MSTSAFYPAPSGPGHQRLVHADNSPLRFLELDRIDLSPGGSWTRPADERECVLVPLEGRAAVTVEGEGPPLEGALQRESVFTDPPQGLYLPPAHALTVSARARFVALLVSAAGRDAAGPAVLVGRDDVAVRRVGRGEWEREVRAIFGPEGPTGRLLVGETLNPPGHWSGMPPHKHDETSAGESLLEEIYYFRLTPPDGYLLQLLYDRGGRRIAHVVSVEGAVAIDRGYHPTVAAPGTTGYYLWALAGPQKAYRVSIDPAFAWMQAEVRA